MSILSGNPLHETSRKQRADQWPGLKLDPIISIMIIMTGFTLSDPRKTMVNHDFWHLPLSHKRTRLVFLDLSTDVTCPARTLYIPFPDCCCHLGKGVEKVGKNIWPFHEWNRGGRRQTAGSFARNETCAHFKCSSLPTPQSVGSGECWLGAPSGSTEHRLSEPQTVRPPGGAQGLKGCPNLNPQSIYIYIYILYIYI